MRVGDFDTQLAAAQLQSLFGIKHIFQRRGRKVRAYEPSDRLLFELDADGFNPEIFEAMHSRSFRKIVSTAANAEQPLSSNEIGGRHTDLAPEKIQRNLETAVRLGMLAVTNDNEFHSSKQTDSGPVWSGMSRRYSQTNCRRFHTGVSRLKVYLTIMT
jgi:hypothetical protein